MLQPVPGEQTLQEDPGSLQCEPPPGGWPCIAPALGWRSPGREWPKAGPSCSQRRWGPQQPWPPQEGKRTFALPLVRPSGLREYRLVQRQHVPSPGVQAAGNRDEGCIPAPSHPPARHRGAAQCPGALGLWPCFVFDLHPSPFSSSG